MAGGNKNNKYANPEPSSVALQSEGSNTIRGAFEKNASARTEIIETSYDCSELTIPTIMPRFLNKGGYIPKPRASLGAKAVGSLANKMLEALLPSSNPFFKIKIKESVAEQLRDNPEGKSEIESSLASLERGILSGINSRAYRTKLFEVMKYLVVTGNALIYMNPKTLAMSVFRLDHYTVSRDPEGRVVEIITLESAVWETLPLGVREKLIAGGIQGKPQSDENFNIYTRINLEDSGKYSVSQECAGVSILKEDDKYEAGSLPWIPIRWSSVAGEDYGRGIVEEYLGDLRSYEGLTQSIVTSAAVASKVVFMIKPSAAVRSRSLVRARSGDFVTGNADDVSTLQVGKYGDFQTAERVRTETGRGIAEAFLMTSAMRRDAERVTAEEIRLIARELESTLGGVYSSIAYEFQIPFLGFLLKYDKNVPTYPKQATESTIITGFDALGRGAEVQKLDMFIERVHGLGEQAVQTLNYPELVQRYGADIGVDMAGIIKTPTKLKQENVQQAQQAQAQMEEETGQVLTEEAGKEIIKQVGAQAGAEGNPL